MSKKTVSGTKEWASTGVNVMTGCVHGCLYCYASASAFRFDRVKPGEWGNEFVNEKMGRIEKIYSEEKNIPELFTSTMKKMHQRLIDAEKRFGSDVVEPAEFA